MKMAAGWVAAPPPADNDVVVHNDSQRMFDEMTQAMRAARSHIHME